MARDISELCSQQVCTIYNSYSPSVGVSIDSRRIVPGVIFFGLPGTKVNGGHFVQQVLDAGAALAVVEHEFAQPWLDSEFTNRVIGVDNVLQTLQTLARLYRESLSIPVVAITGTNGKTTTRELLVKALSTVYRVGATSGNYNNELGVPISLLNAGKDNDILVLELGANHQRDILELCAVAQPTHGLITTIGEAHLEGFESIEGVAQTKGELFQYLKSHGGTGFVREDDEYVAHLSEQIHLGCSASPYSAERYKASSETLDTGFQLVRMRWQQDEYEIKTSLVGAYNLINIIAALHVASYFNVPLITAISAIENYYPSMHRSQLMTIGELHLIVDCYNANPMSMRLAIEGFRTMPVLGSRILILGEMRELGVASRTAHEAIYQQAKSCEGGYCFFIGAAWESIAEESEVYPTTQSFLLQLESLIPTSAWVLLKGSRSVELEKILPALNERFSV